MPTDEGLRIADDGTGVPLNVAALSARDISLGGTAHVDEQEIGEGLGGGVPVHLRMGELGLERAQRGIEGRMRRRLQQQGLSSGEEGEGIVVRIAVVAHREHPRVWRRVSQPHPSSAHLRPSSRDDIARLSEGVRIGRESVRCPRREPHGVARPESARASLREPDPHRAIENGVQRRPRRIPHDDTPLASSLGAHTDGPP